jgi:hypothetical protein
MSEWLEVDEERRLGIDVASDERLGAAQVLGVAVAAHVERQLLALGDLGVAALALGHAGDAVALGVIPGVIGPQGLVVGARRPAPFLEAFVGRPAARSFADMPLPVGSAGVAGLAQQVGDGLLPRDQAPAPGAPIGTVCVPERIAWRPVSSAERVGVHCDSGQ